MRDISIYFWKQSGVDPMYCEEDDEKSLHIKEHTFKKVTIEMQDKTTGKKVKPINIYCCDECGMHAIFNISSRRTTDIFGGGDVTVHAGEVMPFKNGEAIKEYIDGNGKPNGSMFCDFITCSEHKIKDILE